MRIFNYEDEQKKRDDFLPEKIYLAKKYNVNVNSIVVDEHHPCGELCIFIKNIWHGYLDNDFYNEFSKKKNN